MHPSGWQHGCAIARGLRLYRLEARRRAKVVNTSRCLSSARSRGSPRVATDAVRGDARRHAGFERRRQQVLVQRPQPVAKMALALLGEPLA